MGIVIVKSLAVVVALAIIAGVVIYIRRRQSKDTALDRGWAIKGDLNASQEQLLIERHEAAARIFRLLLEQPHSLHQLDQGEVTILARDHKDYIEQWLNGHAHARKAIGQ